ncbi:endonuclease III domain-containing protein [bacterium]|nr:endonuclease III domain-containing protein [bacterium]
MEKRRRLLHELYDVLERAIGPTHWWPAETPFEVCIGAILTQNAPWTGVVRAIEALKNRGVFDAVSIAEADERVIAEAVRPTIYYNQKARRLKVFCRFLLDNFHGGVENMAGLDCADARKKLLALPGIGYETADSMLLYALGKPIFVVDAYTKRIFTRHGLAEPSWDYEELRSYFEDALDPDPVFYGEFHGLICLLGAEVCRRKPLCDECPLYGLLGKPVV